MRKKSYLSLLTGLLFCMFVLTACSVTINLDDTGASVDETKKAVASEVTQEDVEKLIIGKWITSEIDGQPAPTNLKSVYDIVSNTQVFSSVSHTETTALTNAPWIDHVERRVDIDGNTVTISTLPDDGESVVHEFTITNINTEEFTANKKLTITDKDKEPIVKESVVKFVKLYDDYNDDVIGIWEGHCTSEGSVFDDGQEHRWEYKDDGTFVYYVKDGDDWITSNDTLNEYFVDGNLLCTRWMENGAENREWWEISIDGNKMNWSALREDEDGKTFTATFEMTKVQ